MYIQGFPILYTLATHQPSLVYCTGHHLPYEHSSQHDTQQTEQDINTIDGDPDITDNVSVTSLSNCFTLQVNVHTYMGLVIYVP